MFSELREAGGPIDTIGNDAAQLVVSVDDAFQLVGGLGEDPAARTCSLRTERSRGKTRGVMSPSAAMLDHGKKACQCCVEGWGSLFLSASGTTQPSEPPHPARSKQTGGLPDLKILIMTSSLFLLMLLLPMFSCPLAFLLTLLQRVLILVDVGLGVNSRAYDLTTVSRSAIPHTPIVVPGQPQVVLLSLPQRAVRRGWGGSYRGGSGPIHISIVPQP